MPLTLPILDTTPQRPLYAQGPRSLHAIKLLRISITDRCNLRCVYCMPEDGVDYLPPHDLLSPDDIVTIAKAAQSVGVTHFKITGGEPTVRKDLLRIVADLSALHPHDLSLTTNGMTLDRLADDLRQAGLHRLTVSCDSLQPDRFARITRGGVAALGGLSRWWKGIEAAQLAGFQHLKINVVVMAGINDDEVLDFARLTLVHPWTVRFIEYMPLGDSTLTASDQALTDELPTHSVDNQLLITRITNELGPLTPVQRDLEKGVGPAHIFQLPHAKGRLGFISAMSKPFCETCNRLRLTAQGQLRSCLFDGGEVSLLDTLRQAPPAQKQTHIIELMRQCVALKPQVHSSHGNRAMSQLGG